MKGLISGAAFCQPIYIYIYIYISRAIHLGSILCALDEHTGAQAPRGCTELPPRASNPRRTPTGRLQAWWGEPGLETTTSRLQSYALYHLAPEAYINIYIYIYIHAYMHVCVFVEPGILINTPKRIL